MNEELEEYLENREEEENDDDDDDDQVKIKESLK
jgi:hypothetical protein